MDCLHEYKGLSASPFLIQIIKSKEPEILKEAMTEWIKILVDRDNENMYSNTADTLIKFADYLDIF